ncbi:hypothetical protein SteCoe_13426 [Stentor coeruleus]|uniref:Tubulin--tyrosine ligase-like protein 9 n=1 Tax=Stentor coeruleus TaxID=5963 RepID=A0A1R2C8D1_9CILI|nr:hypothetical protein SteCoe_13426 [Stentor coeruleus]
MKNRYSSNTKISPGRRENDNIPGRNLWGSLEPNIISKARRDLSSKRVQKKQDKDKIFSVEQSIQFSPMRSVKSSILKAIERESHISTSPSANQIKSPGNFISYIRFTKNSSQKALKISSPCNSPKFLSPASLTTRKLQKINHKKSRNRIEDDKYWRKLVNDSNGIEIQSVFFTSYIAYIGKGNNSNLVKKTIQSRNWWTFTEFKEKANFVWTQWKDKPYLGALPCFKDKNHIIDTAGTLCIKSTQNLTSGMGLIANSQSYISLATEKFIPEMSKLHNKIEFNHYLSNKKDLFLTMKAYYNSIGVDVFEKVPLTFHVSQGEIDPEFLAFNEKFSEFENRKETHPSFQNLWIIKPGEFTNRGQGIKVCKTLQEITSLVSVSEHTFIIQKYIENPLLIAKRKFDIRCYSLITCINGIIQGYFYLDGYLRTTSHEFTMKDTNNLYIHLTNDAIQKYSKEYGKFENGNKLSYKDFQRYLEKRYPEKKINFYSEILPQIKEIVRETILANYKNIDINRRLHCMEIFGYDFMIDRNLKPWLIEVNTNPCLELSSKYLSTVIPSMLENAFKIVLDCMFPPPIGEFIEFPQENRFELIFHEFAEGSKIEEV